MEYKAIRKLLQQSFEASLAKHKADIDKNGRLSEKQKDGWKNTLFFMKTSIEDGKDAFMGDTFDQNVVEPPLQRILESHSVDIAVDSPDFAVMKQEYKVFLRDLSRAILAYDTSFDHAALGTGNATPPFTPATIPTARATTLKEAIDAYTTEKLENKSVTTRSANMYKAQLDLLLEFLGEDATLDLTRDEAHNVRLMLRNIPKNRNSASMQGLTIEDLMELDEKAHPRLSTATIKQYLTAFSSFYEWASRFYDFPLSRNYFADLQKGIKGSDEAVRDPFSPDELRLIMDALLAPDTNLARKDHHKWGTLIAIYTGARRDEIAQLELDDIKEMDGILCFDINKESKHGTKKKLKTTSSKRIIPVHSDLIKFGFLDYVSQMKNARSVRLFPDLHYDAKEEGYGRALGRWVNETLLPHLSLKSGNIVFHSFRHTLNHKLHNAGVPEKVIYSITGHEREGVNAKYYMKKGYTPSILQDALEKVKYP